LEAFRTDLAASAPAGDFADWRHGDSVRARWTDDQDLRKAISGIRAKLRTGGGNAPLLIPCLPERGRFSLTVPRSLIFLQD